MSKTLIDMCRIHRLPLFGDDKVCRFCERENREAIEREPYQMYQGILDVKDEATKHLLLRQFGQKYFPELCDLLTKGI